MLVFLITSLKNIHLLVKLGLLPFLKNMFSCLDSCIHLDW